MTTEQEWRVNWPTITHRDGATFTASPVAHAEYDQMLSERARTAPVPVWMRGRPTGHHAVQIPTETLGDDIVRDRGD